MAISSAPASPLSATTLDAFRARLHGEALTSTDPGYDEARRIWNAMIDKRPALIARCADANDIAASCRCRTHYAGRPQPGAWWPRRERPRAGPARRCAGSPKY